MTMFSYMSKMLHFFIDGRRLGVQNVGYETVPPEFQVDALYRRLHDEQQAEEEGGGGGGGGGGLL
jgi:hypothetical protein